MSIRGLFAAAACLAAIPLVAGCGAQRPSQSAHARPPALRTPLAPRARHAAKPGQAEGPSSSQHAGHRAGSGQTGLEVPRPASFPGAPARAAATIEKSCRRLPPEAPTPAGITRPTGADVAHQLLPRVSALQHLLDTPEPVAAGRSEVQAMRAELAPLESAVRAALVLPGREPARSVERAAATFTVSVRRSGLAPCGVEGY